MTTGRLCLEPCCGPRVPPVALPCCLLLTHFPSTTASFTLPRHRNLQLRLGAACGTDLGHRPGRPRDSLTIRQGPQPATGQGTAAVAHGPRRPRGPETSPSRPQSLCGLAQKRGLDLSPPCLRTALGYPACLPLPALLPPRATPANTSTSLAIPPAGSKAPRALSGSADPRGISLQRGLVPATRPGTPSARYSNSDFSSRSALTLSHRTHTLFLLLFCPSARPHPRPSSLLFLSSFPCIGLPDSRAAVSDRRTRGAHSKRTYEEQKSTRSRSRTTTRIPHLISLSLSSSLPPPLSPSLSRSLPLSRARSLLQPKSRLPHFGPADLKRQASPHGVSAQRRNRRSPRSRLARLASAPAPLRHMRPTSALSSTVSARLHSESVPTTRPAVAALLHAPDSLQPPA
ncbi:hypothetical protein CDD83_3994 [Cordyceps sp. RAO-2017]|nr:hypothetical protein CDD83_3994 [Cordyceps sp. RAO-2017]